MYRVQNEERDKYLALMSDSSMRRICEQSINSGKGNWLIMKDELGINISFYILQIPNDNKLNICHSIPFRKPSQPLL